MRNFYLQPNLFDKWGLNTLSKIGDRMICSIWSGNQPGIYIGFPKRREYFSKHYNDVIIDIDGEKCIASLPPSFWRSCPEIRVARSKTNFNVLMNWIRKNGLLSPRESIKKKGRKDTVILEVIEPYRKFKLYL